MAVLGIQNIDAFTKRISMYSNACSPEVMDEALATAGDVLADALSAATPSGESKHKDAKGKYRNPGNARASVINVPARSKLPGVARRLIGYSKQAYYMLWVIKGHQIVVGGPLKRKAHRNKKGGMTHSQSGKGVVVGNTTPHDFMSGVFKSNIRRAMEAAEEVVRKAAQTGTAADSRRTA